MEAVNALARLILLSEASAVLEPQLQHRQRFGSDVRALLDQGCLIPAVDYINAQRLRRKLRREFAKLWSGVDVLIAPTTPNTAPRIGEKTIQLGGREEDVRLASTRLVRGFNLLGYPALSIPCGLSGTGLPIGLQIVGAPFEEALVLRVGAALEDGGVAIPPCPCA
jgi:aspartyl-tRNA(Asn)/glutamyl-tRNA(Gln) amidotransferase subunit A